MKIPAQKHPVITFLLINFAWTWLFWSAAMPFRGQALLRSAMSQLNLSARAYAQHNVIAY